MSCDHDNGICFAFEFKDDLTLEELYDRLVHFGFIAAAPTPTTAEVKG